MAQARPERAADRARSEDHDLVLFGRLLSSSLTVSRQRPDEATQAMRHGRAASSSPTSS